MPRLDTKKIPGFDSLPEDARAYLSSLETVESSVYNQLASANGELTKQLRAKQTEEERIASEQAAKVAAEQAKNEELLTKLTTLEKAQNIMAQQTRLMALGYDDALAKQAAEHLVNGDYEKFNAAQAKFLEARDAKQKEQRVNNTPYPPNGSGGGTVDLAAQITAAQAENDFARVAQLTRMQQQQQQPQTPPTGT